jgi:cytochrome P450
VGYYNVEQTAIADLDYPDFGFGSRAEVFAPLIGKGIFTQEGAAWRHSREGLRKQFVRARYQDLEQFREHVDNLIAQLPRSGVVDLQPLFFSLTLDTTTALLFGKSVYSLRAAVDQDAENKAFAESFNVAQEGLAKRFRLAPWHFFYSPVSFRRACKVVHRYVERYIQRRTLTAESDEADEKAGLVDQMAGESSSDEELRDQLVNILLAGRDTTACCLSWTL